MKQGCSNMMKLLFIVLWGLLHYTLGQQDRPFPVVTLRNGKIRGKTIPVLNGLVNAYLGIPYAEAPTRDRRFKPPVPKTPWKGTYNARDFGNACMQIDDDTYPGFRGSDMWNANVPKSEDCLYLNVWVPSSAPKEATVMVWIYGGGFYSGVASLREYAGETLAYTGRVIVVSMNYRVGALGFLALDIDDAPGNMGLLDQNLALRWVQENIGQFGGNPDSVTIFGESAGAASVGYHLLSPLSRHLFKRGIMQSASPNAEWASQSYETSKRRGGLLADAVGCPSDRGSQVMVDCLKKIPADEIIYKEWVEVGMFLFPFHPVVDGYFVPEHPNELLRKQAFKKTEVLIGFNKDEGSWFLVYLIPGMDKDHESLLSREQYLKGVQMCRAHRTAFGLQAVAFQHTNWKNPNDGKHNRDILDDIVGDYHLICPVIDFASSYATSGMGTYLYLFSHNLSNNNWPDWMGVMHGYEIEVTFGLPISRTQEYTPEEDALARRVVKYWTNFAKTGDPNQEPADPAHRMDTSSVATWPRYDLTSRRYLEIALNGSFPQVGPRTKSCAFWQKYLPQLERNTANITEEERQWKDDFYSWRGEFMPDWRSAFKAFVERKDREKEQC
ncbi:ACHE [Branchiostoma lanceolatum]|uniref:Carboxylic ester hydrolase n=1 Tax=Branchiostoma lanceolatum TaxID=7740 RepID=A0A8K0EDV3_BRALA|nr:ACHE [Branchiostoma lanceolatum]